MTRDSRTRNINLDIVKCIAALMVVWIHYNPLGDNGDPIKLWHWFIVDWIGVCRIGVAMFFVITGFYLQDIVERERLKSYVCRILRLLLLGVVTHSMLMTIICVRQHLQIPMLDCVSNGTFWWNLLFLNSPGEFGLHLWFLLAVVYSVLILSYPPLQRVDNQRFAFVAAVLWGIGWIMQLMGCHMLYFRNFLFYGLPCVYAGMMTRRYVARHDLSKLPYSVLWGMVALAVVAICVQNRFVLYSDIYLLNLPACVAILLLCIKADNLPCAWLAQIGRRYSSYIYVFHMDAGYIYFLCLALLFDDWTTMMRYATPVNIFLLSLMFAMVYVGLRGRIVRSLSWKRQADVASVVRGR